MKKLVLDVPAMFGDHHVLEVRRILTGFPGVETVLASSAFRAVEIEFDPARTSEDDLRASLEEAGYLGDLLVPVEGGKPVLRGDGNGGAYFRHSSAYETAGPTITFGQEIPSSGRPLWPCPGMGPVRTVDE